MTNSKRKVLVIGWDAADWKVINNLIEKGKMPHTEALIERGVMGNLATLQPVLSPMLWTTIATGKRPYKHGILGFSEPTPDGAGIQPVSQLSRSTKAIWNMLNQEGYRSNVISWWPSHPVEPINGVMVSNHYHTAVGPPDQPWPIAPGMVHPKRLVEPLSNVRLNPNELIPEQILPFVPKALEIDQDDDPRLGTVMKILAEATSVHAAATWALQNEPWDFFAVYYDAIDHFGHGFMKYRSPRRPHIKEEDFEFYKGVVDMGYEFHDMMLGATLNMIDDATTVIVCSDHGFHPDHLRPIAVPNEPAGPAIEHRDLGMLIIAGPGIKKDALIHGASVMDITPTILALYGLPVGDDMDGKPLLDIFETEPEITLIPSWDDRPGDHGRLDTNEQFDPIAAKEAMDQLVALGYIEKLDDNIEAAINKTVREMQYNLARSYMDANLYREAVPILLKLYQNNKDQYRFGVQLAMCYRALGGVTQLRQLVESLTVDRKQGALDAQEELKTTLAEFKNEQQKAGTLKDDGELDTKALDDTQQKAITKLQSLSRFNTFDLDYLMGWVLSAEKDPKAALVHLKRAEQAQRERPGLHLQIGEAYLSLRVWKKAEGAFREALALDPLNPHAHLGLARIYLPQRRNDEAIDAALESVRLYHHNPMAHYILGLGLIRMKQNTRALEALDVAVSINPNFERAHRVLARLKWKISPSIEATDHLRLVHEIRKNNRKQQLNGDPMPKLGDFSSFAQDSDEEGNQLNCDEQPQPLVDKSNVPIQATDCITIVAGLPRSGTSMMMQMLAAAPMPILTDEQRIADSDNPKGYYELEDATRLHKNTEWLDKGQGKVVKIVAQLLPRLPAQHFYRIVFIERDLAEVAQSQHVMLKNFKRDGANISDEQLISAYRQQLRQVKTWLAKQTNIMTLFVPHRSAIEKPLAVATEINDFLGGSGNPSDMAAVIDPTLYRQKTATSNHTFGLKL